MRDRVVFFEGPGRWAWRERDLAANGNDVLVRTAQASICGTDKNIHQGRLPETRQYPFAIGHEGGGVVEQVGPKVRRFRPGDRVMSFGWHGTWAGHFVADEDALEPAPEGLDLDIACLGEPLACAMYSGLTAGVELGDTVAVFGMGFAGQVIAQVAKAKGAHTVVAVDLYDGKLELARRLGADVVLNAGREDAVAALRDLTGGRGVDVAVEAAGTEAALNACSAALRHNGRLALYSWITQPVTLNISRWHDDGLEIRTTCLVHHTLQERMVWTPWSLRPVLLGMVQVRPLVTHVFPLADVGAALEAAVGDPSAIKVCLKP